MSTASFPIPCLRGRTLAALLCVAVVSACAVMPKDDAPGAARPPVVDPATPRPAPPSATPDPEPAPSEKPDALPSPPAVEGADIALHALGLLGVPYRWGGTDPQHGLDCSGLVWHVFQSVRGQTLPRRSVEMSRTGEPVARHALSAGDLVFFNTLGYAFSHVAIYIGDGRFVHAPARRGVVRIEAMDEGYWRARYNGARRIPAAVAGVSAPPMMSSAERERGQ